MYHPMAPGQMHPASLALRVGPTPSSMADRLRKITTALHPTLRVDEVLAGLSDTKNEVLTVLIPNGRGYELAVAAGAKSVCMVLYGSDGMAQANVNMSRNEAEAATAEILKQARADGVRVTSTIAVAF